MTSEEAKFLEIGLRISAARLHGDISKEDELLGEVVENGEMPRLVEAFVYVALTAAELIARDRYIPFQEALQGIPRRPDVVLLDDPTLGVGSWEEIVKLAGAVKRSHDEARETSHGMDGPGAINASFQLAISALTEVAATSHFSHKSPAQVAEVLIQGIEQGYA